MIQDGDSEAEEDLPKTQAVHQQGDGEDLPETQAVHQQGDGEDLPETQAVHQQGDGVSVEAQDDVLELLDSTEPLSSTLVQDISENAQLDDVPPESMLTTDGDSEQREASNKSSSTSVAGFVSYINV